MRNGRIGGSSQVDPVENTGEQPDLAETPSQSQGVFNPDDWVSQAEAARLRGVSRQAIADLIKRGRLATFEIGGNHLVNRFDVLHFEPSPGGRPKGS